ncbi:hypothetical protein CAUP111243_05420 [Campylobacter upsaliensis]|uniref:Uncharacterized protein n=1 Tax=Campylobacter upsaliensis TaxID=28080 RepID=A0A448KQ74_CAMUP|nr:hypothetical protein [Campylobacter upsaliensis]MCA5589279.1 hypothetical protein [Campylobacter upsaliensis]VEG85532.1 Uncharacterised protein [Campylobacter upsaliensis]
MIKPRPSFQKCLKCGEKFLARPKSDALNPLDFICSRCKGERSGLLEFLSRIFKFKN